MELHWAPDRPLVRSAPGHSPAATWPDCGGVHARPVEPRRQLAHVLARLSSLSAALPRRAVRPSWRAEHRRWPAAPRRILSPATRQVFSAAYLTPSRDNPPRPIEPRTLFELGIASMARRSLLSSPPKHSTEHPHHFSQLALNHFPSPCARAHRLQPPAARTELESRAKFVLVSPPFPNPSRTELDHFPSFLFPHFSRALPNSPARNRIFPQILISGRRSIRTSSTHFEASPRSTGHPNSSTETHWCSRTPPTPVTATTLAGIEPAAAAPPPHVAGDLRASSDLPIATIRLVVSHWFFRPLLRPPPAVVWPAQRQGALADGIYHLHRSRIITNGTLCA
nr:unnamed protein product [Digitaria exilis]